MSSSKLISFISVCVDLSGVTVGERVAWEERLAFSAAAGEGVGFVDASGVAVVEVLSWDEGFVFSVAIGERVGLNAWVCPFEKPGKTEKRKMENMTKVVGLNCGAVLTVLSVIK